MTSSHEDEGPVLGPLRDDYKATPEDRARVWTKLRGAALARAAAAPEAPARLPPSRRVPWRMVLPSCALLALLGGARYGLGGASGEAPKAGPPALASSSSSLALEPPTPAQAEPPPEIPAADAIGVHALPAAPRSGLLAPSGGAKASSPPPAPPLRPTATHESVASPPVDTLEEETRLLGEAARAVRAGNGARALALVEEHAQRFPRGQLVDERDVQRILAHCSLGQTEEATRRAQTFLAGRASSSLTRRVEESCIRR